MAIVLRPVTRRNWETAAKLGPTPEQQEYIAPNVWSIAESHYHSGLLPIAIYSGGQMVGFLMWGVDPEDGLPWLYRFMIDARFQRQGFGAAAIKRLLSLISQEGHTVLNVGYHPENYAAAAFYRALGFEPTGTASWGELTARKVLRDSPT